MRTKPVSRCTCNTRLYNFILLCNCNAERLKQVVEKVAERLSPYVKFDELSHAMQVDASADTAVASDPAVEVMFNGLMAYFEKANKVKLLRWCIKMHKTLTLTLTPTLLRRKT